MYMRNILKFKSNLQISLSALLNAEIPVAQILNSGLRLCETVVQLILQRNVVGASPVSLSLGEERQEASLVVEDSVGLGNDWKRTGHRMLDFCEY